MSINKQLNSIVTNIQCHIHRHFATSVCRKVKKKVVVLQIYCLTSILIGENSDHFDFLYFAAWIIFTSLHSMSLHPFALPEKWTVYTIKTYLLPNYIAQHYIQSYIIVKNEVTTVTWMIHKMHIGQKVAYWTTKFVLCFKAHSTVTICLEISSAFCFFFFFVWIWTLLMPWARVGETWAMGIHNRPWFMLVTWIQLEITQSILSICRYFFLFIILLIITCHFF